MAHSRPRVARTVAMQRVSITKDLYTLFWKIEIKRVVRGSTLGIRVNGRIACFRFFFFHVQQSSSERNDDDNNIYIIYTRLNTNHYIAEDDGLIRLQNEFVSLRGALRAVFNAYNNNNLFTLAPRVSQELYYS